MFWTPSDQGDSCTTRAFPGDKHEKLPQRGVGAKRAWGVPDSQDCVRLRQEFQKNQISYKLQCVTSNGRWRWHMWHWTIQNSVWPPRQQITSRSKCHTKPRGNCSQEQNRHLDWQNLLRKCLRCSVQGIQVSQTLERSLKWWKGMWRTVWTAPCPWISVPRYLRRDSCAKGLSPVHW